MSPTDLTTHKMFVHPEDYDLARDCSRLLGGRIEVSTSSYIGRGNSLMVALKAPKTGIGVGSMPLSLLIDRVLVGVAEKQATESKETDA